MNKQTCMQKHLGLLKCNFFSNHFILSEILINKIDKYNGASRLLA